MDKNETKNNDIKAKKKSSAKIAGVKSVMKTSADTTVIAVFGKGNEAVLEKRIINNETTDISKSSKISVDAKSEKKRYVITSKSRNTGKSTSAIKGYTDKPDEHSGLDLLGLKDELEQEIFNDNFQDNLRVQIAYNIFDIVKALAPVANNITYTLNSLDRKDGHKNDIIGFTLNYSIAYNQFGTGNDQVIIKKQALQNYIANAKNNFIYYDDIFYHDENDKKISKNDKKNSKNKTGSKLNSDEDIYYSLGLINFLRNSVSHFGDKFLLFKKDYQFMNGDLKNRLDETFRQKVRSVNKNFIANEKNNLWLAANALNIKGDEGLKNLACELYKLSVLKSNRNLGFNLKKLRESALNQKIITLPFNERLLNTFKSKLYKIFDFVIIHHLTQNDKQFIDNFVDALRKSKNDDEKEQLYEQFAGELFNNKTLKAQLNKVIKSFSNGDYKKRENVIKINPKWIESVEIDNNAHDFSKLVYFISRFLDGKEINILFTSLISKFQVIDAFNKTVSELVGMNEIKPSDYSEKYGLFNDSGKIAEELNFIKSITKMTTKYENASLESMYKDALLTLGVSKNDVDRLYKQYFDKNSKTKLSAFFKNNILESGRFKYVIKYLNPSHISKIARNKAIAEFVLNRMPDTQIERYYISVVNPNGSLTSKKNKIHQIADLITKTNFDDFTGKALSNVKKGDRSRKGDMPEREKKKALLSLYYTIVYIFVKNLVQINSCYLLGYFYLERDKYFFGKKYSSAFARNTFNVKENYDALTRLFTGVVQSDVRKLKNNDAQKLKRYIYVSDNPNGVNSFSKRYDSMYREFRNSVDHINVISDIGSYVDKITSLDSYFDVYHFILQRKVYSKLVDIASKTQNSRSREDANKSVEYINSLLNISNSSNNFESGENVAPYSRTLLRAANVPMGYTLPRYKNLSYEKLFVRGRENS